MEDYEIIVDQNHAKRRKKEADARFHANLKRIKALEEARKRHENIIHQMSNGAYILIGAALATTAMGIRFSAPAEIMTGGLLAAIALWGVFGLDK